MSPASQLPIRIGSELATNGLSKGQKDFNRLIQKIEKLGREVTDYQDALDAIERQGRAELDPLVREYQQQRADLVRLLDRAYDSGHFKANDKKKLAHLIQEMSFDLIANAGLADLKTLYDKYDPDGFEAAIQQTDGLAAELLKQMSSDLFGVDIPDEVNSPEQMAEFLNNAQQDYQDAYEKQQQEEAERRAKRKKSARQQKLDERRRQEERNISRSVRSIYMDLVKAFHPDREPDEAEKLRKTEIMHRVTEAYEKNDLMALLRLQLEFDRIDQAHLETLAEEQLGYYNKILKQQVSELESKLTELRTQASALVGQPPYLLGTARSLHHFFEEEVSDLRRDVQGLKSDLRTLSDPAILKQWLKSYRIS